MNPFASRSLSRAHAVRIAMAVALFATPLLASPLRAADPAPGDTATPGALVQRDAVRLNLAGAQRALQAALAKAKEMQLVVNISVVDEGGHPLAFARMDGARPASAYTAMTKATTAALIRAETGPIVRDGEINLHLNIALQNAAAASGGTFTTLHGGVPIVVDGHVIGALGVGGAKGEEDREIARAGAAAVSEAADKEAARRQ